MVSESGPVNVCCFLSCSDVYKLNNIISSFQEFLDNLYRPLFEVTIDPHLHPELHMFLQYVSDCKSKYSLPIMINFYEVSK